MPHVIMLVFLMLSCCNRSYATGLIAASRINAEVQEVDLGDLSLAESTTDHPGNEDAK